MCPCDGANPGPGRFNFLSTRNPVIFGISGCSLVQSLSSIRPSCCNCCPAVPRRGIFILSNTSPYPINVVGSSFTKRPLVISPTRKAKSFFPFAPSSSFFCIVIDDHQQQPSASRQVKGEPFRCRVEELAGLRFLPDKAPTCAEKSKGNQKSQRRCA
ncbi:MAG: hypothetical protein JWM68_360 [Verrucomicrobiales bacterium]|nr:hypothetical protein [Verrucomicrobiales bacterium]